MLSLEKNTFVFDVNNDNYVPNHDQNIFFITRTQNYLNDVLKVRGYVFLNDVLKNFNIAPTMIGQLAGWRADASGYIEIKIKEVNMQNGRPYEYILEIKTDGIIIDVLGD